MPYIILQHFPKRIIVDICRRSEETFTYLYSINFIRFIIGPVYDGYIASMLKNLGQSTCGGWPDDTQQGSTVPYYIVCSCHRPSCLSTLIPSYNMSRSKEPVTTNWGKISWAETFAIIPVVLKFRECCQSLCNLNLE